MARNFGKAVMSNHGDDWTDYYSYRLGTTLDDYFDARDTNDLIIGLAGNDTIFTGDGFDIVIGGAQDDVIIAGDGINWLRGGLDSDVFEFEAGVAGITFIRDFVSGEDKIDLSNFAVTSLAEIQTASYGFGSFLFIGAYTIHVNLTTGQLTDADFIFGPPAPPPVGQLLDFEDLADDVSLTAPMPIGYEGLTWLNFSYLEHDEFLQIGGLGGFQPESGDNLAFNTSTISSISSQNNVDFDSFYLSAGFRDGLEVTVIGFDDGGYVGEETFEAEYGASTMVKLDDAIFDSVDHVEFAVAGGTDLPGDSGNSMVFGLDDLLIFT